MSSFADLQQELNRIGSRVRQALFFITSFTLFSCFSHDAVKYLRHIRHRQSFRRGLSSSEVLVGFKNTWEPLTDGDNPVFWHIPKSGGSYIKTYLGSCYGKVISSEVDDQLKETSRKNGTSLEVKSKGGYHFVNVDTTTREGIRRAKVMGFAESGLAEVTISTLPFDVEMLFSRDAPGRVFTLIRNPIDRVVDMFNYLRRTESEPTYDGRLKNMTLAEYATSDLIEDNFVTRTLVNKKKGELNEKDAQAASKILNKKVLVGLTSRIEESLDRFEKFFNWHFHDPDNQEICRTYLLATGGDTYNNNEQYNKGSSIYEVIAAKNEYDMRLYSYAQILFEEQESFVKNKPNDFRLLTDKV